MMVMKGGGWGVGDDKRKRLKWMLEEGSSG